MMADERRRQPERIRDRADRMARGHAREHDPQPRRIAQQAEQIGERHDALVFGQGSHCHEFAINI